MPTGDPPTRTTGRPPRTRAPRPASAGAGTDEEIAEQSLLLDLPAEAASRLPAPPEARPSAAGRRYTVLGRLGAGGMATVYLVYDRDLRRRVALKVLRTGDPRATRRLLEEAQVMAQLDHPNVVPVFEVGRLGSKRLYYTMRVVRGRTLADVIGQLREGDPEARRTWSLARRMQVFVQIGQAVAYAHGQRVLHRDLKPSNVMLGAHGEVQVMDWGLCRVLGEAPLDLSADDPVRTRAGAVVGTPSYMSPEQALGRDTDARSDVYALGVMLYELLALSRPFSGKPPEVMRSHVADEPEPPRLRAPDRDIPLPLEQACLRALRKAAADRPQSVEELLAPVQDWLEAEADRGKRRELAAAKVAEAREALEAYRRTADELAAGERAAEAAAGRVEPWQPAEEKLELIAAEDRVAALRGALAERSAVLVETLERALEYDEGQAEARALLAGHYWSQFLEAEREGDERRMELLVQRVRRFDDGRYVRELEGAGSLALTSDPPGAAAELHRFVPAGFTIVPEPVRSLGETPFGPIALERGSWLVVLRKPGFRDVRYPVLAGRSRAIEARVRMFREEEIPPGHVHVPAGTFVQGGDPACRGWSLPRAEPWVDDFFIAIHPVTVAEYLPFLNAVARAEGLEAAKRRAPRPAADAPPYTPEDGAGGLLAPPGWRPRIPVVGVSRDDALAYAEWQSERDGFRYRLPTEPEWEKAARGVDGRWFPWGWRFDASLCNMGLSQRERAEPVPVDEFPSDVSVYGVRGMAGNSRDWTSTIWEQGAGGRARDTMVVRGGTWAFHPIDCRAAFRNRLQPWAVNDNFGFRLAASPRDDGA